MKAACCNEAMLRRVLLGIASLFLPGLGQAAVGQMRWAIGWAAAVPVVALLAFATPWAFYAALGLRLASAAHAFVSKAAGRDAISFQPAFFIVAGVAVVAFVGIRVAVPGYTLPSSSMCPTLEVGDHVFLDRLSPLWHPYERGEVVAFHYPCEPKESYLKRIVALGGDTVEVRCNVLYLNGTAVPNTLVDAHCQYQDRVEGRWLPKDCSRYQEVLEGHAHDALHDPDRPARDRRAANLGDVRDFPSRNNPFPPSCRNASFDQRGKSGPQQPQGTLVETKPPDRAAPCEPQLHYVVPAHAVFVLGDNRANSNDSRSWGVFGDDQIIGRTSGVWLAVGANGIDWSRIGAVR